MAERKLTWRERMDPGYRGTDLAIFSVVWVLVGLSILLRGDPDPKHTVPIEFLGEVIRAAIWFACAAFALVTIYWPKNSEALGFAALIIPAALRMFSYITAVPMGMITHNRVGYSGAWLDAVAWTFVTLLVYRLARRPEVPLRPDGTSYSHDALEEDGES